LSATVLLLCALAGADAGERLALLPLDLGNGLAGSRVDLQAAVVRGLAAIGRPVIGPEDAAGRAGAPYLVSARMERTAALFRVSLRLLRAADGSVVATEENTCEVADCSLAELARRSARELVRQTLGRPEAPAVVAAPAAPEIVTAPVPPPPAPPRAKHRVWPAVILGVGAAAAGLGAVLIKVDGDCTDAGRCSNFYNTLWPGVAAVGLGLTAVTVGGIYLWHDLWGSEAAVALSPGGLVVSGRY
jgi:hypothetical protein